jgi:hypothetical protein
MFALYLIMFWLAVGGIALVVFYWRKEMKMTSSTTGWVVCAQSREICDDAGRRDETVVVAKYTVSGREYEISHVFRGKFADRFPAGRSVPIRYNPSDPRMARIPVK